LAGSRQGVGFFTGPCATDMLLTPHDHAILEA